MLRMGRMGRPGLIGLAARTAVVAGTATAVSGSMSRNQQKRSQAAYEQQQYEAAQQQALMQQTAQEAVAQQASQQPAVASSTSDTGTDLIAELQKLAALRDSGTLSEEEFSAAKAKLLG